ncbi:MAG: PKD domain-containing protein [Candidatus Micrarchaeota archaeon]|nr:PKD domain-containing protein [Candidatus Micrarchaeota archaeon]MDE1847495.1 PKD domain-containing protein [Candidatus Micrarchaeota archaeon]MDE1863869.1 PKD domain-containing protein [Candidatus Micrarchaeota archaeon]
MDKNGNLGEDLFARNIYGIKAAPIIPIALIMLLVGTASAASFSGSPTISAGSPQISISSVSISGSASPTASQATNIAYINWNWGDGQTTSGFFPQSHTYTSNGDFIVRITAYDNIGNSASTLESVNINNQATTSPSQIPIISYSVASLSNLNISLTGYASGGYNYRNQRAQITSYIVSWGDGSSTSNSSAAPSTISHAYTQYQNYPITINVKDSNANTNTTKFNVDIEPPPGLGPSGQYLPVMSITPCYNGGESVTLNGNIYPASGSGATAISSILVYWGDQNNTATSCLSSNCTFVYSSQGTFNVRVIGVDNKGNRNSVTLPITVPQGASGSCTSTGSTTAPSSTNPIIQVTPAISGQTVTLNGEIYTNALLQYGPQKGQKAAIAANHTFIYWGDTSNSTPETFYQCERSACSHTYPLPGNFTISIAAIDTAGNTNVASMTAQVGSYSTTVPNGPTNPNSSRVTMNVGASISGYTAAFTCSIYTNAVGAQLQLIQWSWGDQKIAGYDTYTMQVQSGYGVNATLPSTSSYSCPAHFTHTYPQSAGIYNLTVTATDNAGDSNQYIYHVMVPSNSGSTSGGSSSTNSSSGTSATTGPSSVPTISVTTSTTGYTVSLNGNIYANAQKISGKATMDTQNTIISWGDHNNLTTTTLQECEAGSCNHTYSSKGTYTIGIVAVDSFGNKNYASLQATVPSSSSSGSTASSSSQTSPTAPPVIEVTAAFTGNVVQLNGSIYAKAVSSSGTPAVMNTQETKVSWGDPSNLSTTTMAQCATYCGHQYSQPGNYIITIVALDNLGNTAQKPIPITIPSNSSGSTTSGSQGSIPNPTLPPTISVAANVSGATVTLNGSIYSNAVGTNGQNAVMNTQGTRIYWDDPNNLSTTTMAQCATYCGHTYLQSGTYIITIEAIDSLRNTAQNELTVTVSSSASSSTSGNSGSVPGCGNPFLPCASANSTYYNATSKPIIVISTSTIGYLVSLSGNIYASASTQSGTDAVMNTQGTKIYWGDPNNLSTTTMAQCATYCSHYYSQSGAYTITIEAIDSFNNTQQQFLSVRVPNVSTSSGSSSNTTFANANPNAQPSIQVSVTSTSGQMAQLGGNIWANAVGYNGTSASINSQNTKVYWGDENNLTATTLTQCYSYCGHYYSQPGSYTITVEAVDNFGNTAQKYINVYITASSSSQANTTSTTTVSGNPNAAPVVQVSAATSGYTVSLGGNIYATAVSQGGASAVMNTQGTKIYWGDPNNLTAMTLAVCESGSCSHTYSQAGNYTITVEAVDNLGNTNQQYLQVSVPG